MPCAVRYLGEPRGDSIDGLDLRSRHWLALDSSCGGTWKAAWAVACECYWGWEMAVADVEVAPEVSLVVCPTADDDDSDSCWREMEDAWWVDPHAALIDRTTKGPKGLA